VEDQDPRTLHLDVYETQRGLWNPEHGEIAMPPDWEFLPSGDTFVTKQVKAAGAYWTVWRPRGKNRPHRRRLGLCAPTTAVNDARGEADATAERRAKQRILNSRRRDKIEAAYRGEFAAAVFAWLDFAPQHAALAEQIAHETAARAVEVGSGRVGRTRSLALEERAALAARATIRHRFTDYEDHLVTLDPFEAGIDDYEYRAIKQGAHDAVDDFLRAHRRPAAPA
jgi:hypothetical protein